MSRVPQSGSSSCSVSSEFDRALLKKATRGQEYDMNNLVSLEPDEERSSRQSGSMQRVHVWLMAGEESKTRGPAHKSSKGRPMNLIIMKSFYQYSMSSFGLLFWSSPGQNIFK